MKHIQTTPSLPLGRGKRDHSAFSAVEIMMVAAVIAILTLLALPMFHKQIERARINGCRDEMKSMAGAQDLAYAETGYFYRLNDLDNTTLYTASATSAALEVPVTTWNRELTLTTRGERWQLARSEPAWNGSYCRYPKFVYLDVLLTTFDPLLFRHQSGGSEGPILILYSPDAEDHITVGEATDKYPIDPWGNPYIFFGEGQMIPGDSRFLDFPKPMIVSMGPNGLPGDGSNVNQDSYWREKPGGGSTRLGTGDDLVYEF